MLLTIAVIVSSVLIGLSPVLFKKWIIVNIYPKYGSIWECVLEFIHEAAELSHEGLRGYFSKMLELLDKYVVTGGLAGVLGYIMLVLCFRFGQVSTIFSISSLQFVVTATFSHLYLKERLSTGEIVGMAVIIVGVSLLVPQA